MLNLFFPKVCLACDGHLGDNEAYICTFCRNELPITNFHSEDDNAVAKRLYGRVNYKHATSLLWFNKKGIVQHLIHNLKYKGHEEVGVFIGQWLGEELRQLEVYKDIDVVVPVPLHKSKLRKRGYNQVDKFGMAIAKALNVEYNSKVLVKTKATSTQVFKDRLKRILTHEADFSISESHSLKGKHILLVDDIITTGATLEACANELLTIEGVTISVATMAIAE
ncbi:MAG: phosphoribosyltransferase family protein [Aquaticitalea sp.]